MSQALSLIPIGSKVTVDLGKIQDRIPKKLIDLISFEPVGTVVDYKITDGEGIGLVVQLSDGSLGWFFEEELRDFEQLKSTLILADEVYPKGVIVSNSIGSSNNKKSYLQIIDNPISSGKTIFDLLNPFNFFKWLVYSAKDIF